jgi:hypothetical protein
VEILSDGDASHAGLILDISDTTSSTVVCDVPAGFVPGANFQYVIRKHATLSTIFPATGGLVDFEDLLSTYDELGNESIFQLNGGVWEDINTNASAAGKVIYPGQGMVVSTGAPRTVTIGGNELSYVKTTNTRVSVYTAPLGVPNLVGLVNPLVGNAATDVSPITKFGFTALADFEDSIALLSSDGFLDLVSLWSLDGGVVVDDVPTPVPLTTTIKNGTAVVISLGSSNNSLSTLPAIP